MVIVSLVQRAISSYGKTKIVRIHHIFLWHTDIVDPGWNDWKRGSSEFLITLFPMSWRYQSTTFNMLYAIFLDTQ